MARACLSAERAEFTKKLESQTVNETETATIECQLSKPHQTVQWRQKNKPVVQDGRITVNVDTHRHQLIIRHVTPEDAGNVSCHYDNAEKECHLKLHTCDCNNVSTHCTLTVQELQPEFTNTLENQTVYRTVTATFECRLSKPNRTVNWVHNGQQICLDDRISASVAIYTHRLIIQDVTMEDAGTVQCVCSNVNTDCTLTVEELPEENDWFDGERYCNWVKTSLSLCYMKEGITEFSNTKAAAFHMDIKERVSLRKVKASSTTCTQCTQKQARKTKGKDKNTTTWRMNCSMNICNVWLEEILPYHRHVAICPNIEWKNSDPRLWPSDGWEIVKLFQPFGCKDQHKADDCDATGLLTLLLDCSFFNKFMSNLQLLQKIKDVRNVCMHSKDLILTDADMEASLDLMVTFLGEPELKNYPSAAEAADTITQLRDSRLDLSLKKSLEEKVLKDKLTEVKHTITTLDDTDNNLRSGTGNIAVQHDTNIGKYRTRLKEFQGLFSEMETTLQNIIQEKDHDIKKTFTQFIYLMNRLQDIAQDNREVDEYYQPKLSTLESEQHDVTSEFKARTEQPGERQLSVAAPAPCFSKELRNQAVYEKATVTLECQLSQPNQTVRWVKGVTQVCSSDRITVEAYTDTHRLIIRDVTLEDAGKFWCFYDNIGSTCTLEVNELAPEFIKKLENHTVLETLTATLVCQLSNPNNAVQWFHDDQQVISDDRITVTADEYTHQLTIRNLKLEDAGNFRCVSGDVSTHCTLAVDELAHEFIGKLDNRNEKEAQTVTLNCQLSRANMKVQWSKAGQPLIPDDRINVTVDRYTHRLVIRDVGLEDAGDYTCVCGSVSTRCTLNVEELAPEFIKKLENHTVLETLTATLVCQLSNPNKAVQWFNNDQQVIPDDRFTVTADEFTHKLIIRDLKLEDAGNFRCVSGDVSTHCTLTVDELAPEFIGILDNRNEKEAQTVTLSCQLSRPNIKVRWSKAGQQIISDAHISVTVDRYNHRLIIKDVRIEDAGDYTCVCGSVSTRCTLNVEVVPELPVKFVKPLENTQGYTKSSISTTLSCELDRPYRNVTWTKGGKVVKSNDGLKIFSGIYTHQLVFSVLTSKVAGKYTCNYGGVSTTAKLTVKNDDDKAAPELKLREKSAEHVRKAVLEKSAVLQQLTLQWVDLSSLGDQLSDVLILQHLVRLKLGDYVGDIKLSHEQCQNLGRDLQGSPQLRELSLQCIFCTTHEEKSGCGELDLGGPLRLYHITLIQLPFTRVVFNPEVLLRCVIYLPDNVAGQVSTLQNLLAARNLQTFTCQHVDDAAAVSQLVDVLPQLHGLQHLTLWHIDFGSVTDIRLSATMDQLESVFLNECKFDTAGLECLLQQHNLPQRRVKIELYDVTIRGEEDVISKIRKSPDTEVTMDWNVKYSEGEWQVGGFIFYTRK